MKNKVQVKIDGIMVTIVGIESEQYMLKVAKYIDKKMAEIKKSDSGRSLNVRLVPILASINIADDYFKEKNKNENLSFIIEKLKNITANKDASEVVIDLSEDFEEKNTVEDISDYTETQRNEDEIEDLQKIISNLKTEIKNLNSEKEILGKEIDILKYDRDKISETSKKEINTLSEELLNIKNHNSILKIQNKNLKLFLENNNIDFQTGLPRPKDDGENIIEKKEEAEVEKKDEAKVEKKEEPAKPRSGEKQVITIKPRSDEKKIIIHKPSKNVKENKEASDNGIKNNSDSCKKLLEDTEEAEFYEEKYLDLYTDEYSRKYAAYPKSKKYKHNKNLKKR